MKQSSRAILHTKRRLQRNTSNPEKFAKHFRIVELNGDEVTDRVGPILIHPGNLYTDIRACILVGKEFQDINGDGNLDVAHSRDTLKALLVAAPTGFRLHIDGIH